MAAAFPKVRIGSYPNTQFDMNDANQNLAYRVKFVLEGRDEEAVKKAAEAVKIAIPGTTATIPI